MTTRETMKVRADPREPFPPPLPRDVLEQLSLVRARTRDPHSPGLFVAGEFIGPHARNVDLERLRSRGRNRLAALLDDERIEFAGVR